MQALTVSEYIAENKANHLLDERNQDLDCEVMEVSVVEEMCRMIRSGRLVNDILEQEKKTSIYEDVKDLGVTEIDDFLCNECGLSMDYHIEEKKVIFRATDIMIGLSPEKRFKIGAVYGYSYCSK